MCLLLFVTWDFPVSRCSPERAVLGKVWKKAKIASEAIELQLCEEEPDKLRLRFDKLITKA